MLKKLIMSNIVFVVMCTVCPQSYGGSVGPSEILTTTYGSGNGQVGLNPGDSGDEFPWKFAVSPSGKIAICDEVNDRINIYQTNGTFERNINILSTGVVFDNNDALYLKAKFRKFNKNGTMEFEKDAGYHEIFSIGESIIGYDKDKKTYSVYSPTGQLIKTSTTRPLELGVVKTSSLGGGRYRHTVQYPDAIYSIISDKEYSGLFRDEKKFVFLYLPGLVDKFNACGKLLGRLLLPMNMEFKEDSAPSEEQYVYTHDQYGEPVLDIHGNVYTWKKSPNKYSILKWTWVDDPNVPSGPDAPTGLSALPSTTGIYLTWTASAQDPGCVTGYEIARATSSGGVYSTVSTVDKSIVKYNDATAAVGTTYYYKVRAKAGSEFSPYTSEVSGKR